MATWPYTKIYYACTTVETKGTCVTKKKERRKKENTMAAANEHERKHH
jgi:hypothetical protein